MRIIYFIGVAVSIFLATIMFERAVLSLISEVSGRIGGDFSGAGVRAAVAAIVEEIGRWSIFLWGLVSLRRVGLVVCLYATLFIIAELTGAGFQTHRAFPDIGLLNYLILLFFIRLPGTTLNIVNSTIVIVAKRKFCDDRWRIIILISVTIFLHFSLDYMSIIYGKNYLSFFGSLFR